MTRTLLAMAALLAADASAQDKAASVQPVSVLFLEAPAGREKSLAPHFAPESLEKVEVHAVLAIPDRVLVERNHYHEHKRVKVVAELADGGRMDLGTAQVGTPRRMSEDRRRTLVSFAISRLPDKPVARVVFEGSLEVVVARGTAKKVVPFDGKLGARVDAGLGPVIVQEVGATTITLRGGEGLQALAHVNLVRVDGSMVSSERGAYSSMGSGPHVQTESGWRFKGPVAPGKLELVVYEGVETRIVPVKLAVKRPF